MTEVKTKGQERRTETRTAKEFLSRYRDLSRSIDVKLQRIFVLRQQAANISTVILEEKVQTSHQTDRVGKAVAEIAGMIEELEGKVLRRKAAAKEIEEAIGKIKEPKYRQVLERRYLLGQSLSETAHQIGYSAMQVNRIHGKALEEIQKQLEKREEKAKKLSQGNLDPKFPICK